MKTRDTDDRGQAFTLEAIVAGILLLTSLVFALQVTAVTPLSSSTSSQHIENQQQAVAEGVLATSDDAGDLRRMVLYWDASSDGFWCGDAGSYYTSRRPDTAFGERIEDAFGGRGVAYNVHVTYETSGGGKSRDRLVYRGAPSDNAVSATRQVTLYDSDTLTRADDDDTDGSRCDADDPTGNSAEDTTTVISGSNFYAPDVSSSDVYNIVRVEVVAWRM